MLGILTILLQHEKVTIPYLADKFEVSTRTISRDIDALCLAGIPLITQQGAGGGVSLVESFKLDKNVLSTAELGNILSAIKGLGTVSQSLETQVLLDKFHLKQDRITSIHEPIRIDLASHYKGDLTEKIQQIKNAILEQRLIEFTYYYGKGESKRKIEPYFIVFEWSAWYVSGFCLERQDWRLFKLTRLWDLTVTSESYKRRDVPAESQDFNAHFRDDIRLVAIFDPSVKWQLIDTYGSDCYVETDAGLRLEVGFMNHNYMTSWLLGFGNKVKVIEPLEMVQRIKDIAKKMIASYE